jgi:hypothetical protein
MNQDPIIIGAGLAGLLAAHAWPNAQVIEASPEPRQSHAALLRFRSDVVGRLTGIPFKAVQVHKAIYSGGGFVPPSPAVCNAYSRKVLGGRIMDRSIWSVDPVMRCIAPFDLYDQLLESVGTRIQWGTPFAKGMLTNSRIINTMPLPTLLGKLGIRDDLRSSLRATQTAIRVSRWRIPRCDVYQTVYFPDHSTPIYRASITGNILTVEEIGGVTMEAKPLTYMEWAFGLGAAELEPIGESVQPYGKLVEMDPITRMTVLWDLTSNHHIYSLGRYATWRNILLDDVAKDIDVIKRLIRSDSHYDAHLAVAASYPAN